MHRDKIWVLVPFRLFFMFFLNYIILHEMKWNESTHRRPPCFSGHVSAPLQMPLGVTVTQVSYCQSSACLKGGRASLGGESED